MIKKTELLRLETELSDELSNLERVVHIIKSRLKELPAVSNNIYEVYIDSIAHNLENFYLAVEEIFKAICVATEEGIPAGERWHSILLKNMSKEIKGLRINIISADTLEILDEYRKFRHLARNIYTFNIVPEKVILLAKETEKAYKLLRKDIKNFFKFMHRVLD